MGRTGLPGIAVVIVLATARSAAAAPPPPPGSSPAEVQRWQEAEAAEYWRKSHALSDDIARQDAARKAAEKTKYQRRDEAAKAAAEERDRVDEVNSRLRIAQIHALDDSHGEIGRALRRRSRDTLVEAKDFIESEQWEKIVLAGAICVEQEIIKSEQDRMERDRKYHNIHWKKNDDPTGQIGNAREHIGDLKESNKKLMPPLSCKEPSVAAFTACHKVGDAENHHANPWRSVTMAWDIDSIRDDVIEVECLRESFDVVRGTAQAQAQR
jgi:hypothetical protein